MVMVLATYQWIEWKIFRTEAGHDSITIARRGPDKDEFDNFVAKLIEKIEVRRALRGRRDSSTDLSGAVLDPTDT